MKQAGEKINTDFSLDIVHNGEEKTMTFSDILTRKTIVSVYMKNNTGGCDNQNKSLAEFAGKFDEKGYNLLAISKDSCNSHKKYAEKLGINYILASDPENLFSQATDSIVEKKMYGKTYEGPARAAFVLDTDGTILSVIEKVDTKNHAQELLSVIESL